MLHCCGPPCLPAIRLWVAVSIFHGVVDGGPFEVLVDGNVSDCLAVTEMACVGCAWGSCLSFPLVATWMVAAPWTVTRRRSAGGSFMRSGVLRWSASTAVTPGKISFHSMVPVGSFHLGAVRQVWRVFGRWRQACFFSGFVGCDPVVGRCPQLPSRGALRSGVCLVPVLVAVPLVGGSCLHVVSWLHFRGDKPQAWQAQ